MILVAGATGYLGTAICSRLIAAGHPVRVLVRETSDRASVSRLRALGIEAVVGDLKNANTLNHACQDVATVLSTATSTRSRQEGDGIESVDRDGQLRLVEAAQNQDVGQFIYLSYTGSIAFDDPLTRAKRNVEHAVQQSGMRYTILRPTYFMEVWLSPALGFDAANARAVIFGSGEAPLSWISLGDVAAFAADSVRNPAALNAVLELGGPEALSPHQVVRVFEQTGGRRFQLQHVSEQALRSDLESAPDSLGRAFAALKLGCAQGDAINMEGVLTRFPMRLTSIADYVASALRQLR